VDQDRANKAGVKVLAHHDGQVVAWGRASDVAVHDCTHYDAGVPVAVALQQSFYSPPNYGAQTTATIVREVGHALGKQ
jgi:hypothetical protein